MQTKSRIHRRSTCFLRLSLHQLLLDFVIEHPRLVCFPVLDYRFEDLVVRVQRRDGLVLKLSQRRFQLVSGFLKVARNHLFAHVWHELVYVLRGDVVPADGQADDAELSMLRGRPLVGLHFEVEASRGALVRRWRA